MSSGRIFGAAILGGIFMFLWGFVSHMVLPIGEMGVESLPNDGVIVPELSNSLQERNFYVFPGHPAQGATEEAVTQWMKRYEEGPRGIVIFDPTKDVSAMSMKMLGTELASNILAALLAAIVLARVAGTRGTRIWLATLIGIAAWLSIDVSYWNWYRFPDMYAVSQLIDQAVGWMLMGVGIALVLGKGQSAKEAPAM